MLSLKFEGMPKIKRAKKKARLKYIRNEVTAGQVDFAY